MTSTSRLSILIALLTLGVLSLLERVLLSTIQYRHGPGSQTADGLALLLADGTKLYSKWGTTDRIHSLYLLLSGLAFCFSTMLLSATATAATQSWLPSEQPDWLILSLAAVLLILAIMVPSLSGGAYTQISLLRSLRGGILADVAIEAVLASIVTSQTAGATTPTTLMVYSLTATCWWLTTMIIGGKPPFDLTEAESEMIAGVMTELAGGIFALALLTEGIELWLYTMALTNLLAAHMTAILFCMLLLLTSFIGRTVLTRITVSELPYISLARLMFIPVSLLNVTELLHYEATTS